MFHNVSSSMRSANELFLETCFEPLDDGTESLDRRGWQQKALARGGHNGSTHNLMSMSAINGPNSFYQVYFLYMIISKSLKSIWTLR